MPFRKEIMWLFCAWVLWVQYETIGVGETKYERSWVPETAYGDNSYDQCIQDIKTLAARHVETSKTMPNVKKIERNRLIGQRESVHTELKTGGSLYRTYVCFPDSVKPQ